MLIAMTCCWRVLARSSRRDVVAMLVEREFFL